MQTSGVPEVPLSELGRIVTGRTPPSEVDGYFGDGCPFITPTDMQGQKYIRKTERELTPDGRALLARCVVPARSVMVSCIGWQLGKVALTDRDSATNQQLNTIVPNSRVESDYLYYALSVRRDELKRLGQVGTRTPIVNKSVFSGLRILLPAVDAQRRIAGILSTYDDLIENCERRILVLDEMARALYREWFVLFRYPGHEKTPLVDSTLGRIPKGWAVTPASQALTINPKVSLPRDGARPFVPMGSLSNETMLISEIETRNVTTGAKFQNGDTLMARITPCLENGKTGFVQFLPDADGGACGSTEFIVMRGRSVPPQYAYCLARSAEFRRHAIKSMSGATGRQRVQEACFSQYFLAQPPLELLKRFEVVVRPNFELSQSFHLRIENLRKTRDLLLPRLLSGQVSAEDAA
jgi:type I restriction enzyme, S subunit